MLFKNILRNVSSRRMALFLAVFVVGLAIMYCFLKKSEPCGTVVILNGPSAVGKSSVIRSFQAQQNELWLGIGIDNFFIGVLPPKFYLEDKPEHHEVMHGIATEDFAGKLFTLHIGVQGQKVIKGMHRAIAAYARAGNNVIVDYIMYDAAWLQDLKSSLSGIPVVFVGLTASLSTIEQREKDRGTSPEGHARSVYESVHQGWKYDMMINTDELTPDQIANRIGAYIKNKKK